MNTNDASTQFSEYETPDQIIASAAARDLHVTRDQLVRWHRSGLIRRPKQVALGRDRGSESRYPKGTAELVVAALLLRPRPRSLTDLAFALWLRGHAVPLETVRTYLAGIARWHDRVVAAMRAFGFARSILPGPARDLLGRIARRRLRVAGVPGITQRLGSPERIEAVFRATAQVVTGAYNESYQVTILDPGRTDDGRAIAGTDSDGLLLERAVGIERGRVDRIVGTGPWLDGDPTAGLAWIARAIGGRWLSDLEAARGDELCAARDQAHELRELFVSFGDFIRPYFGEDAFGFPQIADALRAPTLLQEAGMLILVLRALRDAELRGRIAELRQAGIRWRIDFQPRVDALERLRDAVPALNDLLAPRRVGDAMRDEARLAVFQKELQSVAEANREHIEAVVSSLHLPASVR